ncbi:serine/threonine protein kinase [Clostridium tagluense]|uniref:serine/threonine-protein kinase n=1 Tax=Clostridium tagluense TaxID=360422 RepID=UPI001C0D423A|nr:serine/threonine-protein kinase [Clostridium tagluense]MBU3127802.1 serine/threonine protein kinase [Clostridium tagluense]MCB2310174.1 serine/threonine protein kinase [Clostridium tagluense]MCB2315184.1 serine/threonine protein kinase [Clostridium tagluense]MCB2319874.1 serine/threonine protein kinase [Clostridium tagluense]MCB2324927.1 serine/threonine protein kinase [Clostridium tagluense]
MLNSGYILDRKYEVIKTLGKGGMGTVYLCENKRLGNLWAIKEVVQDIKNTGILTEANILKNLNHVGIRRIVDIFYENNNLYMVQDYVEGQTLKEYVEENGKMNTEKTCRITSDLCDILCYLHNQKPAIIYRDIKPSNIMITPSGKIVLIDFGISKVYKSDTEQDTVSAGSNGFAAPEQYGLGKCCAQTDIYGIGMLIYFMVKGKIPTTGIEPLLDENYEADIDGKIKVIIQKCVKIDIVDRHISAEILKKEILEVLKADKYEKTVIFNNYNSSTKVFIKKDKSKTLDKGKLKKTISGFSVFAIAILASIYILYGNKKESIDMKTNDTPQIVSPIVGSSSVEQEAIKKSVIVPAKEPTVVPKESTTAITQDSNINAIVPPQKNQGKRKVEKINRHIQEIN